MYGWTVFQGGFHNKGQEVLTNQPSVQGVWFFRFIKNHPAITAGIKLIAIKGNTISIEYWLVIHPQTAGAIPPIPKLKKNEIPYPIPRCELGVNSANNAFETGWFKKCTIPNKILEMSKLHPLVYPINNKNGIFKITIQNKRKDLLYRSPTYPPMVCPKSLT